MNGFAFIRKIALERREEKIKIENSQETKKTYSENSPQIHDAA